MLQRKIHKFLSGHYSEKEDSNYTPSYSPAHEEFENLCSPNAVHITRICLQCGKRKQDRHHFFNYAALIPACVSDYRVNTIPC